MSEVKSADFRLPDAKTAKEPGDYFHELREQCPVAHCDDYGGFWLVSRFDDVSAAVLSPDTFLSRHGVGVPAAAGRPKLPLLEQDGPEHLTLRRSVTPWFSRTRMSAFEGQVREVVTRLLDDVIDDGDGNIAEFLCEPLPSIVTAVLLGLPERDWPWFREVSERIVKLDVDGDIDGARRANAELHEYLSAELRQRRMSPADDMLTKITQLQIAGMPISDDNAVWLAVFILLAAHETTVGALGGMVYHVARDHELRDQLLREPALIPRAVEESLRLEPPLPGLARVLARDAELAGTVIPEGARVMLLYGSANRDERVFDDPERFRVDRTNGSRHLTFGTGVHRCLGVHLATLELRVVLEEVLRRMPRIALVSDDAVAVSYNITRAYRQVPVTW